MSKQASVDNLPHFPGYYHTPQLETIKYLSLKGVLTSFPQAMLIKTIKLYTATSLSLIHFDKGTSYTELFIE